jgi:site-specific recombinase
LHEAIVACHAETRAISKRLEATGISVSIVFAAETIEKCLRRMETIADVLTLPDGVARSTVLHGLIAECISATFEDTSVKRLFASNLHLLAKKIVERSGHSGEHYIARNLKEYGWMWLAAAGGGVLTVGTAAFKMRIISAQLAPMQEGLLAGINYSISFLIMAVCGLALATKQPAMTGAALGNIMREHTGTDRAERIIDSFVLICRTQIAAALSNVIVVTIGCLALGNIWLGISGRPILSGQSAEHVLTSLDPFGSGTIIFAAITGVVLWLSSLAGGWVENWSVYNRMPQAIADHRAGGWLGVRRMRWIARVYENNIAAWATCIALGVMLGAVPEFGRIAGFPLDVRHVTLSTGTLALAVASWPDGELSQHALLMAGLGIGVTFVLNLSVSFLLAFATAVRAYDVGRVELLRLAGRAAIRIATRPFDFVLPVAWPREGPKTGLGTVQLIDPL